MTNYKLSNIFIYPVKSLTGIQITSSDVTSTGLKFDRKWMLVDTDGQFLSQRRLPQMTLIKTALTSDKLIITAPEMPDLSILLTGNDGRLVKSVIWKDQCDSSHVSKDADEWFSDFLGQKCQLVHQLDDVFRSVDPDYSQATDQVAFSDGFPFLIISENSLASLNHDMQLNLPMARFRPNLVISGCPAYEEDSWREISIGDIDFRLPKPCSRCIVPTIDPKTAETGKEPLSTLNRLRKWQNKVYFGQNALHNQRGKLTIGDVVTVKLTGAKQPPL